MTGRLSRRALLAGALSAAAATVLVACAGDQSDGASGATSVPPGTIPSGIEPADAEFARPWASLVGAEMTAFGIEVLALSEGSMAHARRTLTPASGEPVDDASAPQVLAAAVAADVAADEFVECAGWSLPRTVAGLAAALAVLAA